MNDEIRFELVPDETKNVSYLTTVNFDYQTGWHVVSNSTFFMWLLIFVISVLLNCSVVLKQVLHRSV